MNSQNNHKKEAAEDIFFGQVVIIWARWFVIAAGFIYVLWQASDTSQLSKAIMPLILVMAVNFFVHGRFLMEKPINQTLLLALSFVDLLVVTVVILMGTNQVGINSQLFIFYYPFLVAFAFVFPQTMTSIYTIVALLAYLIVCLVLDPSLVNNGPAFETLVMRLITMAAVGGLGTYYWRIQRNRRQAQEQTFEVAL